MNRTIVVTGAASGIGAATACHLWERGNRIITSDLHDADVIADLAVPEGRAALVDGVRRLSDGRIDGIVALPLGGQPGTSLALNFFGMVATLEGLRPLLRESPAPRAVAVSTGGAQHPPMDDLVEACLSLDEVAADAVLHSLEVPLDLDGTARLALQRWCRTAALTDAWAGAGTPLNLVAFGWVDAPAGGALADDAHPATMADMAQLRAPCRGQPEAAAAILAWCVSPENALMTGQILFADSGLECRARMQDGADRRSVAAPVRRPRREFIRKAEPSAPIRASDAPAPTTGIPERV